MLVLCTCIYLPINLSSFLCSIVLKFFFHHFHTSFSLLSACPPTYSVCLTFCIFFYLPCSYFWPVSMFSLVLNVFPFFCTFFHVLRRSPILLLIFPFSLRAKAFFMLLLACFFPVLVCFLLCFQFVLYFLFPPLFFPCSAQFTFFLGKIIWTILWTVLFATSAFIIHCTFLHPLCNFYLSNYLCFEFNPFRHFFELTSFFSFIFPSLPLPWYIYL